MAEQAEDQLTRDAALALHSTLAKVVEQNTTLTQCLDRRKSELQKQMTQVEHALQVTKRYYPVSQDHGRGAHFDTQG